MIQTTKTYPSEGGHMRVAFIDDDPNELKILHTYFNDLTDPSTISIDDFSSGEEFLSRFTAGLYDLVTLDIFTGDLTGVDVARKIRETDHNVRLVFCTTSNDFASESYEVAACSKFWKISFCFSSSMPIPSSCTEK